MSETISQAQIAKLMDYLSCKTPEELRIKLNGLFVLSKTDSSEVGNG